MSSKDAQILFVATTNTLNCQQKKTQNNEQYSNCIRLYLDIHIKGVMKKKHTRHTIIKQGTDAQTHSKHLSGEKPQWRYIK